MPIQNDISVEKRNYIEVETALTVVYGETLSEQQKRIAQEREINELPLQEDTCPQIKENVTIFYGIERVGDIKKTRRCFHRGNDGTCHRYIGKKRSKCRVEFLGPGHYRIHTE